MINVDVIYICGYRIHLDISIRGGSCGIYPTMCGDLVQHYSSTHEAPLTSLSSSEFTCIAQTNPTFLPYISHNTRALLLPHCCCIDDP